ncbi:MAG TPA: FecR family protein [Puia sp.]|nr:FecR family protein [Puia sp.]
MADEKRIAELIIRHVRRTLSLAEKEELEAWLTSSPKHRRFLETRVTPQIIAENLQNLTDLDKEALEEKVWDRLRNSAPPTPRPQTQKVLWITIISVLAAATLAWIFFRPLSLPAQSDFTPYHASIWNSQSPAMSKKVKRPTLTMSDSSFYLDSLPIGRLAWLGNWLILKRDSHYIAYMQMRSLRNNTPDSAFNRIAIPPDDTSWKVTLPDGSIIALTPGSSYAFVVHLSGLSSSTRLAVLTGKAMIRAFHNDQIPLYLETSRSEITIHGTALSVRDFPAEETSNILLYNGSVKVSNGWNHILLDTGQQATIKTGNHAIDTTTLASLPNQDQLKDEEFDFSHITLDSALRKLAQWYGISHVYVDHDLYTDSLKRLSLGHIGKDLSLSQLVTVLQMTTRTMHFSADIDALRVSKQTSSGPDQSRY